MENFNMNNMSEKSSMDGSIDEIITTKLKEIHRNNEKYAKRFSSGTKNPYKTNEK